MTPELIAVAIPGTFALLISAVSGIFLVRNRAGGDAARRRDLVPPSWPDIYARLDLQDKKIRLLVGITASVAEQWPADHSPPHFDQETVDLIAELDDTLVPQKWRNLRHRSA
jgi:hypothetical protein